jgi:hypothetical protein
MNAPDKKARVSALAKLTKANRMIESGRDALAAANRKIEKAQKMIDESTDVLRDTWKRRKQ